MPSIKDIARAAGVSITTVSYVLNDKGNISAETRSRVLQVVNELNYTPNTQAQNLRNQETRIIGYAQRANIDQENTVYNTFLQQISAQLEATNRYILVFNEKSDDDLECYQKLIDSQRVDGFVLSYTRRSDPRFSFLKEQGVPFVALGRSLTGIDAETYWVDVDNERGMYALVCHLITMGHTRIGMIAWERGSWVSDLRIQGYKHALQEAGIPFDKRLLKRARDTAGDGYQHAGRLLEADDAPTAICAVSDLLAVGVLHYVQDHGLRVAVTGFDDNPISRLTHPPLTTVKQPLVEAAQKTADLIIAQLEMRAIEQNAYLLPPEILIRASSDFHL